MATAKLDENKATIESIPGGYHLVTCGGWQVSVLSDGMISLPRIVRPQDVDDFIGAMQAAKDVGLKQQEENAKAENAQLAARKAAQQPDGTPRQMRAERAKAIQSARSGGPRGASKTELEPAPTEES